MIASAWSSGMSSMPTCANAPWVTAFLFPFFAGVFPAAFWFPGWPPLFLGLLFNSSFHLSCDFHFLIRFSGTPAAAARSLVLIWPPLSRYFFRASSRFGFRGLPMAPSPPFVCFQSFNLPLCAEIVKMTDFGNIVHKACHFCGGLTSKASTFASLAIIAEKTGNGGQSLCL